jgi:hypothetical protein
MVERLGFYLFRKQLFVQGTWPLWRAERTLRKSAENPDTFAKKIKYKMANDRRDFLSIFADKIAVRNYVATSVGKEYLTSVYAVLESQNVDDFNPEVLPKNFVIKANHGSGAVIIVSEHADRYGALPKKEAEKFGWNRILIHPDNADWTLIRQILKGWLSSSYYYTPGFFPEWAYKNIQPRIMIEEYLGHQSKILNDYRFFTFNGKCEFISTGPPYYNQGGVLRDFYTVNWSKIPIRELYPNCENIQPRPRDLDKMIRVAETLAIGTDHVRVDLYEHHDGRIIFGEMTNYHNAGNSEFIPKSFNFELGQSWHPESWY